jgi:hypothetical protein
LLAGNVVEKKIRRRLEAEADRELILQLARKSMRHTHRYRSPLGQSRKTTHVASVEWNLIVQMNPPPRKRLDTGASKSNNATNNPEEVVPATNSTELSHVVTDAASAVHVPYQAASSDVPEDPAPAFPSCVSCGDDFSTDMIARMPCGHDYCAECLQRVVINSLVDEAL